MFFFYYLNKGTIICPLQILKIASSGNQKKTLYKSTYKKIPINQSTETLEKNRRKKCYHSETDISCEKNKEKKINI